MFGGKAILSHNSLYTPILGRLVEQYQIESQAKTDQQRAEGVAITAHSLASDRESCLRAG